MGQSKWLAASHWLSWQQSHAPKRGKSSELCIVNHWSATARKNVLPKHGFYALQSLRVELSTGKTSYHHASIARTSCYPQLDSVLCAKVAKEPPKSVFRLSVETLPWALDAISSLLGLGRHIVAVILSSVATVFQIKSVEIPVQHFGRRKFILTTK